MTDATKTPKLYVQLLTPLGDSAMDDTNDSVKVTITADDVGIGGGTQYTAGTATFTEATTVATVAGVVRKDTGASLVDTDNEITSLQVDASGNLRVTGGGGGTEYIQDVAHADPATAATWLMPRDDALATQETTDGDWTLPRANARGAQWVELDLTNDVTIADGGNSITVDNAGTFAVQISDTSFAVADGNALGEGILIQGDDGTDRKNINVDATTGDVQVDVTNTVTVSGTVTANAGSGTMTVDLGANNDVTATGNVANDAADSGNPVKIGAHATNSIEAETQVANNDRVDLKADLNGVLITRPYTTLEEIISEQAEDTGGTSTAFTNFAAGGAGVHNYVTTIAVYNSSATDGYVNFRDGTAGAVLFSAPAPQTSGSVINFPVPLKGAANTALAYDVSGALSTVYISVVGFQAQG